MTVNPQTVGINFRLLLQKRQATSGPQREPVPVVVPGRLERIKVLFAGLEVEVTRHVLLRGIDRSPIGVGIPCFAVLHFTTAPIDRQASVATLGIELDLVQNGSLTSAVEMEQARQLLGSLWEAEERRHACRFFPERADVEGKVAINDPALLPLPNDLGVEGLLPGIKVSPQSLDRSWGCSWGWGFRLVGGEVGGRKRGEENRNDPNAHYERTHITNRLPGKFSDV